MPCPKPLPSPLPETNPAPGTALARGLFPRDVDGLSGFEHVADAIERDGTPISVYQLILFAGDYYFLIRGFVGRKDAARYLPLFKQAAHSFRRAP